MKYFLLLLLLPIFAYSQRDMNLSVISAERYAIVYRGISNPIKIAVPGAVSFAAEAPGLKKVDDFGNYDFNVTSVSGDTVSIKIVAKMPDSSFIRESKTFEISNLKMPIALINGKNGKGCIVQMTKKELHGAVISATFHDPVYDKYLVIEGFEIYLPKRPGLIIKGNKINEEASALIEKLKPGDEVLVSNIKLSISGLGSMRMKGPSPIIINIIK